MSAKRLTIVAVCVLVCFLIVGFTCQHWIRVQYHLHALRQANSEVVSAQKEQDCTRQYQALVKLGYMETIVLVMEHRLITDAVKQAFTNYVSERMPANAVYNFVVISSGKKIVCCCQKTEIERFKSVVDAFDQP